ncbi:MAG: hypothetical protein EOP06_32750, partial [Proteobacteria bacterium]
MKPKIQEKIVVRRSVGRKLWNIFGMIPLFLRGPIIRRLFSIDNQVHEGLVFKKAETYEEIE